MKGSFLILALSVSLTAFSQKQFVVDADAVVRPVSGSFTGVAVSGGMHVYVSKSESEVIAVSAGGRSAEEIKTEVRNNTLYISGGRGRNGRERMSVYVGYKTLEQITVNGASDLIIAGVLEQSVLNLQVTGASSLRGEIKVNDLNAKLSGASDMKLSGSAVNANLESSGASDVKSYSLTAQNCNVKASGASDINITVTGEISASASGASDIYYKGGGELKIRESTGASTVARADR